MKNYWWFKLKNQKSICNEFSAEKSYENEKNYAWFTSNYKGNTSALSQKMTITQNHHLSSGGRRTGDKDRVVPRGDPSPRHTGKQYVIYYVLSSPIIIIIIGPNGHGPRPHHDGPRLVLGVSSGSVLYCCALFGTNKKTSLCPFWGNLFTKAIGRHGVGMEFFLGWGWAMSEKWDAEYSSHWQLIWL